MRKMAQRAEAQIDRLRVGSWEVEFWSWELEGIGVAEVCARLRSPSAGVCASRRGVAVRGDHQAHQDDRNHLSHLLLPHAMPFKNRPRPETAGFQDFAPDRFAFRTMRRTAGPVSGRPGARRGRFRGGEHSSGNWRACPSNRTEKGRGSRIFALLRPIDRCHAGIGDE